jgi:hypothetical protein
LLIHEGLAGGIIRVKSDKIKDLKGTLQKQSSCFRDAVLISLREPFLLKESLMGYIVQKGYL